MSTARRKLLWLCGGGAAAWLLGGQLLRSVAGPGYHPPASESPLAYLAILGPAAVCVVAAFPDLRELYLWRTAITDAGMAAIGGLKNLEILSLRETAVSDASVLHLTGLPKLRQVYLGATGITDAGRRALAEALPACEILE